MEPIKVTVEVKKNWAGNPYTMFSTHEHGDIVELDYPIGEHKRARVYPLKDNEAKHTLTNHATFSSMPQGIIGAETFCKAYLFDNGYYVTEFVYPEELKTLRKEAFKENKK